MSFAEKFKGYRTLIFNTVVAALAAFGGANADELVAAINALGVDADTFVTAAVAAVAAVNVFLRAVTNSPIFKTAPKV